MKKWNLWSGSLLTLLGLLVIIFPAFWIKVVVILLGVGAVAYGIYNLKITKALSDGDFYHRTIMIRGIVSILIGVVAILFPLAFGQTMWTVMIWVLIVYLIVSSALGFYAAALLKDTGINRKKYVFENIGLLVLAVVLILISPRDLGLTIIRIVGIVATVIGIIILVSTFISKNKEKKSSDDNLKMAKKADKEEVKEEAENVVVEDDNKEEAEEKKESKEDVEDAEVVEVKEDDSKDTE